jgi:hypothetical protein
LFHLGLLSGLSDEGRGRAVVAAILAVAGIAFASGAWLRGAPAASFVLGACAGYAIDEWLLLPNAGFIASTAIWLVAWAVARFFTRGPLQAAGPPPRAGALAGALILGIAAGFAFALVRPFLFQHVAGTRHGLRIAVCAGLLGLLAGAGLGHGLRRGLPRLAHGIVAAVLVALSFGTAWVLVMRGRGGFSIPFVSGLWTTSWWGRSIVASWSVLGFMTVAFGFGLRLLGRRLAIALLLAGLAAGTWAGEAAIASLGKDRQRFRALADRVARHPARERIEAAEINPDGIWTRYRTRTLLDVESVGFWQATRMDRGALWHNLEAAEARDEWPYVLPSRGFLASGLTLRDSVESLRRRAREAQGGLLVWADPRALTPEGLRSLVATWREALPDGRFSVLVDGFSGPLIGIRTTPSTVVLPVAAQLTIFEAPVSSAFRGELGPPSTWNRPVLEWTVAVQPSPFLHPRGDVMRALVDALAVDRESTAGRILEGLAAHAAAQVDRVYVVSNWDHVAIDPRELDEYMAAFRADESSPFLVRHLRIVFEVLRKKREYATLVRHLEEAVARRPDVLAFHRILGNAYADVLHWPNAIEELEAARALDPEDHDVAIELSRALGGAKRWKDAVAILEAEVAKGGQAAPGKHDGHEHDEHEGHDHGHEHQPPGGAVGVDATRKGLAIALLEAGEHDRAQALLRELLARYPADTDLMKAEDRITQIKGRAESRGAAESR